MSDRDRTDKIQQSRDTLAGRPQGDEAVTGGAVNDGEGIGPGGGGEGDAFSGRPGANSGILAGPMTDPEVPNASMGTDSVLAGRTLGGGQMSTSAETNSADQPMPVDEEAVAVEGRGIPRDPRNQERGGEANG